MKKGNLFLDYDDFCVNSRPVLIDYLNERYQLNLTLADYSDNDSLEKVIQGHRKDLEITFNQAYLDIGNNFHQVNLFWSVKVSHFDISFRIRSF